MMAAPHIAWRAVPRRPPSQAQDGMAVIDGHTASLMVRPHGSTLVCIINGTIVGSGRRMTECKRIFERQQIANYIH